MSIFFLNPIFLFGMLSGIIPIVIHLVSNRKTETIQFSTLRFLKLSHLRTMTRLKLRQIILLLLRILILILISLAISGPVVKFSGFSFFGKGKAVSAVIILDNSYSMAYRGTDTPFDKAKDAAIQISKSIKRADEVALILTNGRGYQGGLEDIMPDISLSNDYADIGTALTEAIKILAKSAGPNKEIYLITDLQKVSWDNIKSPINLSSDVHLYLVNTGKEDFSNTAITDVKLKVERMSLQAHAEINNFSNYATKTNTYIYIDNVKKQEQTAYIDANSKIILNFSVDMDKPGLHHGYISIDHDKLNIDNKYFFTVKAAPVFPLLLVNGHKSIFPYLDECFYLRSALSPSQGALSSIKIDEITREGFLSEKLDKYSLVILANVKVNDQGIADILKPYVHKGGNLLIFLGNNTNVPDYNRIFYESELLPSKLLMSMGDEDDHSNFFTFAKVHYKNKIFDIFEGTNVNLSHIHFYKIYAVQYDPALEQSTKVLSWYTNGYPMFLEKQLSKGRIFLFTSSPNISWNDFPIHPAYLPFLHQIIYSLERETNQPQSYLVNSALRLKIPPDTEKVSVISPDGTLWQTTSIENDTFSYTDTKTSGIYQVNKGKTLFAVNLDTKESDLSKIARDEINRYIKGNLSFISTFDEIIPSMRRTREGVRLSNPLLFLLILLLLIEGIIANRFIPSYAERKKIFISARSKGSNVKI
ncbi:BatA and WFA domain-containing protein [bacterium]|nr:BatA and WFA domain-containing protein [bacterium]